MYNVCTVQVHISEMNEQDFTIITLIFVLKLKH